MAGAVLRALTLTLMTVATARAAAVVEFLTPSAGDMVVGPTEVRFAVGESSPPVERIDVYVDGTLYGTARPPDWRLYVTIPADYMPAAVAAAAYGGGQLLATPSIATARTRVDARMEVVAVQLFPIVRRGDRYVDGLRRSDFIVLDDGVPAEIESFAVEPAELDVALVLDVSASMEDKLSLVQQASARFIARLGAADRVAIYAFDHAVTRLHAPTTDHAAARAAVFGPMGGGGTALYDALVLVLTDLRELRQRKVLLLFSDGRDERSLVSARRVAELARAAEVIVYAVRSGAASAAADARDELGMLAEETGGELHFITDLGDLPRVFDRILADVKAQYSLSFTPRPGPSGVRRLEVRAVDLRYQVRCRRSYYHDDRR